MCPRHGKVFWLSHLSLDRFSVFPDGQMRFIELHQLAPAWQTCLIIRSWTAGNGIRAYQPANQIDNPIQILYITNPLYSTVELNLAVNVLNPDDESEEYYLICQEAAHGDKELESYVKAVHRCNTFDEVCSEMGISNKKYIYNLQRKLKRRIISLSKK